VTQPVNWSIAAGSFFRSFDLGIRKLRSFRTLNWSFSSTGECILRHGFIYWHRFAEDRKYIAIDDILDRHSFLDFIQYWKHILLLDWKQRIIRLINRHYTLACTDYAD
jgi:hypothetical protein